VSVYPDARASTRYRSEIQEPGCLTRLTATVAATNGDQRLAVTISSTTGRSYAAAT
jgi:hypothetical protein